jgi:hypothetical protein
MHACTAQIQNRHQGPDHSQQILRTESLTQTQNCWLRFPADSGISAAATAWLLNSAALALNLTQQALTGRLLMGWRAGALLTDCDFVYFVGHNGYSLPRATHLSLWDFFEQHAKGPPPPRAGLV